MLCPSRLIWTQTLHNYHIFVDIVDGYAKLHHLPLDKLLLHIQIPNYIIQFIMWF